jgi:hypothetical protein
MSAIVKSHYNRMRIRIKLMIFFISAVKVKESNLRTLGSFVELLAWDANN